MLSLVSRIKPNPARENYTTFSENVFLEEIEIFPETIQKFPVQEDLA